MKQDPAEFGGVLLCLGTI